MRAHRSGMIHAQACAAFFGLAAWASLTFPAGGAADLPTPDAVKPAVGLKAVPFPLEEVRLLDGPLHHAMELDEKYILALDVDRLLHAFRVNAGLPSAAKPLGGWEAPKVEVRGHFVGHYMSACALLYASTGDPRFKEKGDRLVAGLVECQEKMGTGYLGAFPEEFIDRVEARKPVWAPYYTLHKILAGLLDMNTYCGNAEALGAARKFADWIKSRCDRLSDAQMQGMLGNEHGGMNEVLANLYARTGEKKYLELSERFNHRAVIDPAAVGQDRLTGLHANTQIPKFIGTAEEYELTGNPAYASASRFFWDTVVKERSYVIGGHSDGEMFSPKETLSKAFGPSTTETCNTYNMLKLTRHLFEWEPKAEYADYYERALFNHILPSQNDQTGMMVYYLPLRPGMRRVFNEFDDSFWCCTGTGVENHAKYGDSIYFHDGGGTLYVNLFVASELGWKEKGLTLRQETGFPAEQGTRLVLSCKSPTTLALRLRHPSWAGAGFAIKVNGRAVAAESRPGSYAEVSREWKDGDAVEVSLPFALRTEGFRDNPDRLAFLHGPLVLAAPLKQGQAIPAIVGDRSATLSALKPVEGQPSTFAASPELFRTSSAGADEPLRLMPLYRIPAESHYTVYFDRFTADGWKAKEAEYAAAQARLRELDARTVDRVHPGQDQSERDHRFEGEKSNAGLFGDRPWRDASDGGFIRYVVKVLPDRPQVLSVTYWGSDSNGRVFDVVVDGTRIATEKLERNHPEEFYDQAYPIPQDLTRGKDQVTVTFQAHPRNFAGGLFGLRVLRQEK
ncbi:Non-reducing end beta-L-arabinofuranosidase [Aquisphaera giovannonii]|uniref:Non-reducing end beta-L-arabinofuranosidase n=1 Tax=Aquisphaera giovannonii TaxID=406548 RepID=A0A5B9W7N1_9BACT|nr:glycoside hydrolase family 127 protein [Aquisphaera giovannonii]QEH36139.1 Non-reducing end beta-L-arabinofuranosidase [Aquisphaera giovannonii]